MSTVDKLHDRARFLRNAAPQAYLDFCTAFTEYTDLQYEKMVDTVDNVQLAQGHAQQCKKILQALEHVKNG